MVWTSSAIYMLCVITTGTEKVVCGGLLYNPEIIIFCYRLELIYK